MATNKLSKYRQTLELAVKANNVENWQLFDYMDELIKQQQIRYNGKAMTKLNFLQLMSAVGSTIVNFNIGKDKHETTMSKLTMNKDVRLLLYDAMQIQYKQY